VCYPPFVIDGERHARWIWTSDEPDRNPATMFTMTRCCSSWRIRPPAGTFGAATPEATAC